MEITEAMLRESSVHLSEDETAVEIIDQTKLPCREAILTLTTAEQVYDAIKSLAVRGAPAIGICAGYAMYVLALRAAGMAACGRESQHGGEAGAVSREGLHGEAVGAVRREGLHGEVAGAVSREGLHGEAVGAVSRDDLRAQMQKDGEYLISSRPTAVNLSWAVKRMWKAADAQPELSVEELVQVLKAEAKAIHREDIGMCRRIAEYGLSLVKSGDGILTHCNAGPLAMSRYGTATGPVFLAKERGIPLKVFSDETRPLLQGARLTSYELAKAGIDVTLICDNMASIVMKNGWVQACFVGCDRIAANGDFANKIGTSGVAVLAKYYGIPFYTLGPTSTIDMDTPTGAQIPIEQRDPDEIKEMWYKEPMALPEVKCYNPAFDVTDHSLVTAIVTDKGIVYPPFDVNLEKIMEQ